MFAVQSEQVRGEPRFYWVIRKDRGTSTWVGDGVYGASTDARTAVRRARKRADEHTCL